MGVKEDLDAKFRKMSKQAGEEWGNQSSPKKKGTMKKTVKKPATKKK